MTHHQTMAALAIANSVKRERYAIRDQIRRGVLKAADVIWDPPKGMLTADVQFVLKSVTRVGDGKVRMVCLKAGVSPLLRLEKLTQHQKDVLVQAMRDYPVFGR